MKKIMTLGVATAFIASLLSGTAGAVPMPAEQYPWDMRVKCQADDPDNRHIVTRYGNSALGWYHFTGRHNIKKCATLSAALSDRVDRDDHHGHLEYDGVVIETGPRPRQAKFTVVVQYTQKSTDRHYDAGRGQKIGVITAYCHNQPGNKCPAWAKM